MSGIDSLESIVANRIKKNKQTDSKFLNRFLNRFLTDLLSEISDMLNPYLISNR